MALKRVIWDNILAGRQASGYFAKKGQFLSSLGIDPDYPLDDDDDGELRSSGIIRPTAMEVFSGGNVNSAPLWFLTNPKLAKIYAYLFNGRFVSYDSALGTETLIGTPTSGAGNGAEYYENYLWLATPTDITRYGPLNVSPSLINSSWSAGSYAGASGGLNKAALTNPTYPSIRGIPMPNHVMHRHGATAGSLGGGLYICDVNSSNVGVLHLIKVKKTTVEGDTDDGSTHTVLDFNQGEWPVAIETYGTDLAVALIEGTDTVIKMKPAKLTFWDTSSVSFSKIIDVEFPDPVITALKNVNGILWVFSGNPATPGCRVSMFAGGYSYKEIAYLEDTYPPFQGAVDHIMNRVIFGGCTTDPENSASVFAIGSKDKALGMGAHNILKTTSANSSNQMVTALKYALQASFSRPRPIVGWNDGAGSGIDKVSTTYGVAVIRKRFVIGKSFKVAKIRVPLSAAVAANMTITPTIITDDGASSSTADRIINNTNFPNSDREVVLYPGISGKTEFTLEFRWTGTALLPIALPIEIYINV